LPEGVDSLPLREQALRLGVDFSPGPLFFPNGGGHGYLRLSYVRETAERIREGVRILGSLIQEHPAHVAAVSAQRPFF
jgi:2-aminoadipate transaminase